MADQFVHLHVHTEYSMLDGAAKLEPLFAEAKRLGQPAVAQTDHGNMFGAWDFYHQAVKAGVKPILGIEAYVAPASRHHKKPVFWGEAKQRGGSEGSGESGDVSGAGAYTHMTMLAKNATGLRNLFALSSLASFQGTYRKPRVDRELVSEYADGIIATTGCPGGEVATRLRLGQYDEARQAAADYRDIFGPENYYVELMDHGMDMERSLREELVRLAKDLDIPWVATNDSHYVTEDQAQQHDALLCLQTRAMLSDTNRFSFGGAGYYLKSAEEMREFWDKEVPGAADRTLEINEKIGDYSEVFAETNRMPQAKIEAGRSDVDVLREEVEQYIPLRFPEGMSEEHRRQLEWELSVITEKGYSSYFLVVGDMVRWAKNNGIRVGPGRGSAAGALLSYILRIIDIDPLKHGLLFERFLNPERDSPPDIDIDFDERRRDEVIDYAKDKYGEEYFAKVITYGTIKTKAAFKDAARVHLGQPGFQVADQFSKALPPPVAAKDIALSGIVDPEHERYTEAAEVRGLIETDPQMKEIFDTARGLEGLIRNAGVHACAHIISREPLLDVLPLWMREDGAIITGWDGPQCEAVGLLKIDILGLNFMTIVDDALNMVQSNHDVAIDPLDVPLEDNAVFELLGTGASTGLFQIEGGGMQELLKRMRPTTFEDIVACVSLYRPGPLDVNAHLDYADRKNGRKRVEAIHSTLADALEPILGDTYGLIVYQEQVMRIAQQLAGYSLGEADLLRKAMGKKKKDVIEAEAAKFVGGMTEKGFEQDAAQQLWDVILPFAGYAFNKSHAAAYGLITYWTTYLKAHYPAEFMASLLTAFADNKDKTAAYLSECRRMGISVLPPDVNESQLAFAATTDGRIRFGLSAIRNVGESAAEAIITTRGETPYAGFADFLSRVPNTVCQKRTVESLIKAGAFDGLGLPRQAMTAVHEDAVEAMSGLKKSEAMGQFDLFGGGGSEPADETASPLAHLEFGTEEWPRKQLLAYEREMLGLYVSAHPLDGAERILRRHAAKPIATLKDSAPAEGEVSVAGLITSVVRKVNKNGQPWAIVTLEDHHGSVEVLFFAKSYGVFGAELDMDSVVAVTGRVNWREDQMSVFASKMDSVDVSSAEHAPEDGDPADDPFVLRADWNKVTQDLLADLRATLTAHPGTTPVRVHVGEAHLALDNYPVKVTPHLHGELKGLPGIKVAVAS